MALSLLLRGTETSVRRRFLSSFQWATIIKMGCWCAKHNEGLRIYILCEQPTGKIETFDLLMNGERA
jgi:hypothetical protein